MSVLENNRKYSAADLLALPDAVRFELVDGELLERPGSVLTGLVAGILLAKLLAHCEPQRFAFVWPGSLGIRCFPADPNKVRRSDVSLLRRERFTPALLAQDFLSVAPDLAAPVLSPVLVPPCCGTMRACPMKSRITRGPT